jgi:uncharacterized protein YuzE
MKVVYNPEVDVLSVLLSDAPVAESDEKKPGVILDYDAVGNMVSFEILDASKRMENPMTVEYTLPPLKVYQQPNCNRGTVMPTASGETPVDPANRTSVSLAANHPSQRHGLPEDAVPYIPMQRFLGS